VSFKLVLFVSQKKRSIGIETKRVVGKEKKYWGTMDRWKKDQTDLHHAQPKEKKCGESTRCRDAEIQTYRGWR
jgi:hypothetical protein